MEKEFDNTFSYDDNIDGWEKIEENSKFWGESQGVFIYLRNQIQKLEKYRRDE